MWLGMVNNRFCKTYLYKMKDFILVSVALCIIHLLPSGSKERGVFGARSIAVAILPF